MKSGQVAVGLGQLIRYLGRMPTFKLLRASRLSDGSIYRDYVLSTPELRCKVNEVFAPNFLTNPIYFYDKKL